MRKFKLPFQIPTKFFLKPIPRFTPTNCVGIDIGTSSIKLIELSRLGGRVKLENYGEVSLENIYETPLRTPDKGSFIPSSSEIGEILLSLLQEAKIQTKKAVFTIPDFSTFFTHFELPPMTKKELPQAIQFVAPRHIPLPLSEVTLDWQILSGKIGEKKGGANLKILLVAVPNEVILQYREIARSANLEAEFLEAETFGLLMSLRQTDKMIIALVDVGARSTSCSVVEGGALKNSHSVDIAGNEMTAAIVRSLGIEYEEAEKLKRKYGVGAMLSKIAEPEAEKVAKALLPSVDAILAEIRRIFHTFSLEEKKEIEKIVLAGGSSLLPGMKEYFADSLQKKVELISPFTRIFYPPVLERIVKSEISPRYAIALGAALRGLE